MPDLKIDPDLTVHLGRSFTRLTPTQGFEAAERLIRQSTRRMMLEEAFDVPEAYRNGQSAYRA